MLKERFCDDEKVKYDNLSTTNDGCSWENTAEEEHQNPMVAMATNDLVE